MPKFGPATRIVAPAYSGRLRTKSGSFSRQLEKRPAPKPVRSTRFSQKAGMIWSVSTSARSSGAAVPVITRTGCISAQLRRRREGAGNGRRGGDGRRHQVRAAAASLAALEVAVAGRGAALARRHLVRVHAEEHRAAGGPPLEAGVAENAVQPLGL